MEPQVAADKQLRLLQATEPQIEEERMLPVRKCFPVVHTLFRQLWRLEWNSLA